MSRSPNKTLLIIGGKANPDPNSPHTEEFVKELVGTEIDKFATVGYDAVFFGADPGNATEVLKGVRLLLAERRWDAVNIGFGVRGPPERTDLFEQLVNMILEEVKPAPRFLFATAPDLVFDSGLRVLGNLR